MLKGKFEAMQIEVGLYGSVLIYFSKDMGICPTEAWWFKNLLCLAEQYGVQSNMKKENTVRPSREGDVALVLMF